MNTLRAWKAKRFAEADADAGVYQPEERIRRLIGGPEVFDTESYPHHGLIADDLRRERLAEEYQPESLGGSPNISTQPPALVLRLGAGFFIGIGAVAMSQLVGIQGWSPVETLALGATLECSLVVLTREVRKALSDETKEKWAAAGVVLIYLLFLVVTAVVRLSEISPQDGQPGLFEWASAVLLVFVAAGPAWLADGCLRALKDSAPHRRNETHASNQLKMNRHRVQAAKKELYQRGVRKEAQDMEKARLTAIYTSVHRQRVASLRNGNGSAAGVGGEDP